VQTSFIETAWELTGSQKESLNFYYKAIKDKVNVVKDKIEQIESQKTTACS